MNSDALVDAARQCLGPAGCVPAGGKGPLAQLGHLAPAVLQVT